jgi:protein-tyrosine phosphatase
VRPINFRDVGEALSLGLERPPISNGLLFRGGRFDTLAVSTDLGDPKTILNLRRGPDPKHIRATFAHVPAPDEPENYDTANRRVSAWVHRALAVLAAEETQWPVYVHCTSGRDRTGVIVAAALVCVGVPSAVVIEEYLLSEGAARPLIELTLAGLETKPLDRALRDAVAQRLLGRASPLRG